VAKFLTFPKYLVLGIDLEKLKWHMCICMCVCVYVCIHMSIMYLAE
jgi:hypothetical protein